MEILPEGRHYELGRQGLRVSEVERRCRMVKWCRFCSLLKRLSMSTKKLQKANHAKTKVI